MNKFKILLNSRQPVTTAELDEILHHEKVNVPKKRFNNYNELLRCATPQMISMLYSLPAASLKQRQWAETPLCHLIQQKDPSYSGDVITKYLINNKKILKLKSKSRMFVLMCWKFLSIIVQKHQGQT